MVGQIGTRVALAKAAFTDGIGQVRLDEMLKKPEDMPLLGDLILDAFGVVLGNAVGKAIKFLRAGSSAMLEAGVASAD